jgi:hypothetical protein
LALVDPTHLRKALAAWRRGRRQTLLTALGFELVGLKVPKSALPDFGIDASQPLRLEVCAQYQGFHVLRLILDNPLAPESIRAVSLSLYRHNPVRRALLIFESVHDGRMVLASWGLGPGPFQLRRLWIDPAAPRRSELDILAGLAVDGAAGASDLALAHSRALDREQVTRRFFSEFRSHRAQLAAGIVGIPADAAQDRLDLALILLSRMLFLYFIQRKGWLAGDTSYLRNLYESALRDRLPFFRRRLKHLFFGALNRPPGRRSQAANELGELPYLNGGLFEPDTLERKYPKLDVADECFATIFIDLLDKYQFTLREDQAADQDVAIDPEMLGKVLPCSM